MPICTLHVKTTEYGKTVVYLITLQQLQQLFTTKREVSTHEEFKKKVPWGANEITTLINKCLHSFHEFTSIYTPLFQDSKLPRLHYLPFRRYGHMEGRKRNAKTSCAAGKTLRCEQRCGTHDSVLGNCIVKPTKINVRKDTFRIKFIIMLWWQPGCE